MTRNLHFWCHSIVHLFTFWSRYGILLYYWNVPINGQTVSNISKAVWISQMSTVHSNSICHSLFSDVIFTKEGIIWKSSLIETIICVTFQTHLQITGLVLLTVVNVKMRRVFNELLVLERMQDYLDYFRFGLSRHLQLDSTETNHLTNLRTWWCKYLNNVILHYECILGCRVLETE